MNTSMLEVKNLSFSYGRRKAMVLEDFSLTLQKGSVYGLLGKNGTGKSTLLYLMAGLLRPQQGNVIYKGMEVIKRRPETLQDMFLVSEEFALPNVSLKQYVGITEYTLTRNGKKLSPIDVSNVVNAIKVGVEVATKDIDGIK